MEKTDRQKTGKAGEDITCRYIENTGMEILARNFHCRGGEIDIIAQDGNCVAFIEVKTRSSVSYGTAAEAVTIAKQRKITLAAYEYIEKNRLHDGYFRFDVAEVYIDKWIGRVTVNYMKNAFEGVMT